ncbi:MAG: hypothetical protein AB7S48_02610 [Bacteroidales bacterium]
MIKLKRILIFCGILITAGLIYENHKLRTEIKVQRASILRLEELNSDTSTRIEYKTNMKLIESKFIGNATVDSIIKNSKYLNN